MANYLKLFDTVSEQNTFRNGSSYVEPHVSCLSDGSSVKYNKYFNANGHTYVDLGLPSGILWASCNLGADNPEDFGENYTWAPSEYTECEDYPLEYDQARQIMGGTWKVPAPGHYTELKNNTTVTRTTLNDVSGVLVTSNINGNTLFFPCDLQGTTVKYTRLWTNHLSNAYCDKAGCVEITNSPSIDTPSYNYNKTAAFRIRAIMRPE